MTTHDITQQLRTLTDHAEITALLDSYQHSLDQGPFDLAWAADHYTTDARIEVPVGVAEGHAEIARSTTEGIGLFARTQHLGLNYAISLGGDGDGATVRANVVSIHVLRGERPADHLFASGGWNDYALLRTPDGWRIQRQSMHLTWTQGEPPQLPATN